MLAVVSGAGSQLGTQPWEGVDSLVRRPFHRQAAASGDAAAVAAVPAGEAELGPCSKLHVISRRPWRWRRRRDCVAGERPRFSSHGQRRCSVRAGRWAHGLPRHRAAQLVTCMDQAQSSGGRALRPAGNSTRPLDHATPANTSATTSVERLGATDGAVRADDLRLPGRRGYLPRDR